MPKASVAVALIARNASETIGACLDSFRHHVEQVVVCVDDTSTDDTARIAAEHGAEVYPIKVSDWHECEIHGRVLAQHFARARNESFSYLRKDVGWWLWVDSDDTVNGAGDMAAYLDSLPPEVDGVWLPYHYATIPGGKTSTLFDRERFIRADRQWEWIHRVHEVIRPVGRPMEHATFARTDVVSIWHQDKGHDVAASAKRNILLLEIELEDKPGDSWAEFYLGNQYFALAQWDAAAHWYETSLHTDNVYQTWQTLIYLSMAYERLGDIGRSVESALKAMDVAPYHPEPYYRMAATWLLRGDAQKCGFWTKLGDGMQDAPAMVFKNPLDRTYNARVCLGQALGNAGRIREAIHQLEIAESTAHNDQIAAGLAQYRDIIANGDKASAIAAVLAPLPDEQKISLWQQIDPPPEVRQFGRVRDVVMPAMLRARPNTQPRIVFWCGRSVEPWAPVSLNTTGIGGSETAVIEVAKRFAADGWRVDVYNGADRYEGEYDGVGYWDPGRLGTGERADGLVSWRQPVLQGLSIDARMRVLWCHDLNSGPGAADSMREWPAVLGVSEWHANYLASVYGLSRVGYVPNGIDLSRFSADVKRVPWRCVYASSPDRGLELLLKMWPEITAAESGAELHVAYGWETFDKYIAMGRADLAEQKARLVKLLETTPRVVWRGRLPQDQLARLYQESVCWLYPTAFLEVSCISAMEAMAGGCTPVTSEAGALPETIGDGGLIVKGNTYSKAWKEFYVLCARAALLAPDIRAGYRDAMRARAEHHTWDNAYKKWQEVVGGLLEGER